MKHNYKKFNTIALAVMIAFQFLSFHGLAHASTTLSLQTNTQNVSVGQTVTVDLSVSSPDQSINVLDGTLTFDESRLEVQSISINNSLFSLWPVSPVFHNNTGLITFVGGVPDGFQGTDGHVLQISFIAKKSGTAKVDFQNDFSVFLNDGLGTRVNPWLVPVSISIHGKPLSVSMKVLSLLIILLVLISVLLYVKIKRK